MGKHYGHVTIEERCEIARLRSKGRSVRQIAAGLDRSPSTVARELKRNMSRTRGYQPVYADQQARARRWRGSRLERDDALRAKVLAGLKPHFTREHLSVRIRTDCAQKRTTRGATTCLVPSRSVAGEGEKEVALLPSSLCDVPLRSVRRAPQTAKLRATGRPT